MKKIMYLWCAFALLVFAGCSSDKDDLGDSSQDVFSQNEEIFLAQANMEPEFNNPSLNCWNFNPRSQETENTGAHQEEITQDGNGITKVSFRNTLIEYRPSTSEEFVATYIGVDFSENYQWVRSMKSTDGTRNTEVYDQYYKGVKVGGAGFAIHYKNDERITLVTGSYLPVKDLDVNPAFSVTTARNIYARYLNVPVEYIGEANLVIGQYPLSQESDQFAPRLTYYLVYINGANAEGYCSLDAKTGRILVTRANYILN